MFQLGLIGHPVKHSKSPYIHQYFLNQINKEGTYHLFDLKPEELKEFLENMRHSDLTGINVTVPYKEKVIPFLDVLDEQAKKLNAVNTIKRKGNRLIGYNTDGEGYIESLKQKYPDFYRSINQQSILILGAGGAAKGIYNSLKLHAPKRLDVANRTISKAKEMTNYYEYSQSMDLEYAETQLGQYDLVIQTTNVGMEPNENELIISLEALKENTIVSDIVYKPKWTLLLTEAERFGARLLFGESMLWYQAAKSFNIWTEESVDHTIRI